MKKKWVLPTVLVLLIVALGGGLTWYEFFRPYVRTNDAQIDGFKVAVSSDITARIIKLYVDEGSSVKEGDLIADLDDSILQSQKKEAQAKIETLEASVIVEQYHFEKTHNDFERAVKGFEEGVVSSQGLDHAEKNFLISKSKLEMTQKDLKLAKEALGVIEAMLLHTKVWAPITGKIVKRWVFEGDVMHPGQAIFSLYDLKNVWILANLEETKMKKVRLGDPVEISIDMYPGVVFTGKIFVIKGAAASEFSLIPQDNATGNYTKVAQRVPLKISIDSQTSQTSQTGEACYLFPGMSAEVKVKVL
ncbi:MAG: HlyD family secretion protein [Rhabdochlamydiaceae bacterium]